MAAENHGPMGLDRKEIDNKILDELHGGRNVPSNLADELDVSRQYISQRLKLLEAADHVENIGRGVYELVDDPRRSEGYRKLGDDLDWEKLGPVTIYDVDRLEYVLEALQESDELAEDLTWETKVVDTSKYSLTVEEVLGALGEAKHLLEYAKGLEEDLNE